MTTNYDSIIPHKILFNLKEIEQLGILKTDMTKKLVFNGFLEVVRIGRKIHISREELIRYLESNTYPVKYSLNLNV
uniref:DNA-binding protein n=1 Tax=Aliarcobacter sp. TaxID=2321116 RepID=UPI004047499A